MIEALYYALQGFVVMFSDPEPKPAHRHEDWLLIGALYGLLPTVAFYVWTWGKVKVARIRSA